MRRGGIQGAAILAVAIVGGAFDPALAVGLTVVIFLTADIQAVVIFFKQVDWKLLGRLLMPTAVGIGAAAFLGPYLPEATFGWILFAIILISFSGMLWQRRHDFSISGTAAVIPITLIFGFLSGFTSMIGNLSSVFVAIFFTVVRSGKNKFIATTAWFFFIVNLLKLPVHLFIWKSLNAQTTLAAALFLPLVAAGILLGRYISGKLNEERYWNFIVLMVSLGMIRFLIGLLWGV